MICPACGAENADNAEFCTLCLTRLERPVASKPPSPGEAFRQTGEGAIAPGVWSPDVVADRDRLRPVVRKRVRRYTLRMAVYGAILAALVAWFVLSLTVWSNPQPVKRASQIIDALNAWEEGRFVSLFLPSDAQGAERIFREVSDYLGRGGSYHDLRLRVDQEDNYTARVVIESGSIRFANGETRAIEAGDSLVIRLENRKGKWLAASAGTDLIP